MEMASSPRTVEEIYKDFCARRAGVVRALTYGNLKLQFPLFSCLLVEMTRGLISCFEIFFSDVDEFYGLCDPGNVFLQIGILSFLLNLLLIFLVTFNAQLGPFMNFF